MRRGLEKGKGQGNQVGKDVQIVPTVEPILKPTELSDWLRYWCGCGFLEKATPNWAKAISLQRRPLSCLQPVLLRRGW